MSYITLDHILPVWCWINRAAGTVLGHCCTLNLNENVNSSDIISLLHYSWGGRETDRAREKAVARSGCENRRASPSLPQVLSSTDEPTCFPPKPHSSSHTIFLTLSLSLVCCLSSHPLDLREAYEWVSLREVEGEGAVCMMLCICILAATVLSIRT